MVLQSHLAKHQTLITTRVEYYNGCVYRAWCSDVFCFVFEGGGWFQLNVWLAILELYQHRRNTSAKVIHFLASVLMLEYKSLQVGRGVYLGNTSNTLSV